LSVYPQIDSFDIRLQEQISVNEMTANHALTKYLIIEKLHEGKLIQIIALVETLKLLSLLFSEGIIDGTAT
jgi:hypothetical protein